jgi:hypothetical protein
LPLLESLKNSSGLSGLDYRREKSADDSLTAVVLSAWFLPVQPEESINVDRFPKK